MNNIPEWALPIRDEMARAMAIGDSGPDGSVLFDIHWREFGDGYTKGATAALTVALPLMAEHMAGVAESEAGQYSWDGDGDAWIALRIAAAIRQEAKTKNAE